MNERNRACHAKDIFLNLLSPPAPLSTKPSLSPISPFETSLLVSLGLIICCCFNTLAFILRKHILKLNGCTVDLRDGVTDCSTGGLGLEKVK